MPSTSISISYMIQWLSNAILLRVINTSQNVMAKQPLKPIGLGHTSL